jgi:GntR family transcriptional regulator, transcriptional repressor for pyruvate dehydrogenase complex
VVPYNVVMLLDLEPVDIRAREPISSEITRRLVDYLISGEIQPGGLLPSERSLAESLGVGRSHVRQAVKSLVVLGLIDVRQGAGTYLKRTDSPLLPLALEWGLLLGSKSTADLIDARRQLEVVLAGLAAEARTDEQLVEMHRLLSIMERTAGTDEFVDADVALHLQITMAAGNQSLLQIMRAIRTLLEVWVHRVAYSPGTAPPTWAEHAAVVHAIEESDPSAAREAMEYHMARALDRLQDTLSDHDIAGVHAPKVASWRAAASVAGSAQADRGGSSRIAGLREPIDTSGREGTSIEISRQLLDYLLSGRVQPGERLPPERKLAEALGVGRSVLREALRSLTLLGLLEVRLGDGTYVKRTDAEVLPQTIEWGLVIGTRNILDLVEARRHLEIIVAGLAAGQHDEVALGELRSLLAAVTKDVGEAALYRASEGKVLRRIGEAAGNEVLTAALATIRSLLQVWLGRLPNTGVRETASLVALEAVIEAVGLSDVQAARNAMARYVDIASKALLEVLPEGPVRTKTPRTSVP